MKIFLCFLLLSASVMWSQQLRFRHITSEEGLSTNFISTILQDEKGFMWFGTQDGLNRYDAYHFRIFKHDPTNKNSLSNSEITALKQLRPGLLLVGTNAGLNFFDLYTEKFQGLEKAGDLDRKKITAICVLNDQRILIGTEEGLYAVDAKTRVPGRSLFPEPVSVNCIEQVGDRILIGTEDRGLWQFTGDAVRNLVMELPQGMDAPKPIKDLQADGNGNFYMGTFGAGIFEYTADLHLVKVISFSKHDENGNYVRDLAMSNNNLYAATAMGVAVYHTVSGRTSLYTEKESSLSLNSNACNALCMDKEGNLWVATGLGGVNVSFYQSLKFPNSHYNYETQFPNIYAFYENNNGSVLLGSDALSLLDPHTGQALAHAGVAAKNILSIVRENDHVTWIGTWGNALYRYDETTRQSKKFLSDQLGGTIVCLKIDGDAIYAGSVGDGLFRIDLKTFETTRFTVQEGLPDPSINAIFKDSKNNVWLGTYNGGLVKLSGFVKSGRLPVTSVYNNKGKSGQIASNAVLSINEDKNGHIWAATSTGLSKLKSDGTFYNFYEKDGLANSYLYAILKDSLNNFWMSSNGGLITFNPQLPEKDIVFKNYSIKDGLVNKEYNMGAAFVSPSGQMYFGGAKGFNIFRPTAIKDNLHVPAAYVVGYKRGGRDVQTDTVITYKKELKLSWRENYFQFEITALDYTDPAKNKFKYRLEGYDNEWSSPGNVRYISYTELPGGDYTFQVLAANNDGVWSETPYELKITVVPPFWKTKWFYFLVIVLGAGGVVAFTQYRTKAIKKENRLLEAKVAERTKELAEKNHDIMSSIEYAKRIQEAMLPSRDLIFKKFKKVFILYKPKDIVSGDFYWFSERSGVKIFAVVDCTGHGVPGAFMSMIGHNLLNQIVLEKGITDPGEILNNLHRGIQEALRQGKNEINTNDGMDVSLLTMSDGEKWVRWAGANRPLVTVSESGELTKYDANKFPVGGAQLAVDRVFTTHAIPLSGPMMAYMTSDGYADQFGGPNGKKFMVKRYHELLEAIHLRSAEEQRSELETAFEEWKVNHEQVDDVLVVGIEINY